MPKPLPQLDHYVGRTVRRVIPDNGAFTVVLDGNKHLHFQGSAPARLERGMQFMEVGESGDERELRFCRLKAGGVIEHETSVITEQGEYTISDEGYEQARVDPSIADDEITMSTPPDPSPDRDKGASTSGG